MIPKRKEYFYKSESQPKNSVGSLICKNKRWFMIKLPPCIASGID